MKFQRWQIVGKFNRLIANSVPTNKIARVYLWKRNQNTNERKIKRVKVCLVFDTIIPAFISVV